MKHQCDFSQYRQQLSDTCNDISALIDGFAKAKIRVEQEPHADAGDLKCVKTAPSVVTALLARAQGIRSYVLRKLLHDNVTVYAVVAGEAQEALRSLGKELLDADRELLRMPSTCDGVFAVVDAKVRGAVASLRAGADATTPLNVVDDIDSGWRSTAEQWTDFRLDVPDVQQLLDVRPCLSHLFLAALGIRTVFAMHHFWWPSAKRVVDTVNDHYLRDNRDKRPCLTEEQLEAWTTSIFCENFEAISWGCNSRTPERRATFDYWCAANSAAFRDPVFVGDLPADQFEAYIENVAGLLAVHCEYSMIT